MSSGLYEQKYKMKSLGVLRWTNQQSAHSRRRSQPHKSKFTFLQQIFIINQPSVRESGENSSEIIRNYEGSLENVTPLNHADERKDCRALCRVSTRNNKKFKIYVLFRLFLFPSIISNFKTLTNGKIWIVDASLVCGEESEQHKQD